MYIEKMSGRRVIKPGDVISGTYGECLSCGNSKFVYFGSYRNGSNFRNIICLNCGKYTFLLAEEIRKLFNVEIDGEGISLKAEDHKLDQEIESILEEKEDEIQPKPKPFPGPEPKTMPELNEFLVATGTKQALKEEAIPTTLPEPILEPLSRECSGFFAGKPKNVGAAKELDSNQQVFDEDEKIQRIRKFHEEHFCRRYIKIKIK